MRIIYIALAVAATSALAFMLLWAQSESEKAQLLNKYEVIRSIARQEQDKPHSELAPELQTPTVVTENRSAQTEMAPLPANKPAQSKLAAKPPATPAAPSLPTPAVSLQPENLQKIQNIQQRLLAQMATGKAINIDEVAKLLTELQGMEKTGINFQGLDFSLAQKNLELAKKIQEVSQDIQVISKATPPDSAKLNAALEQLNKLQAQIKSPVSLKP